MRRQRRRRRGRHDRECWRRQLERLGQQDGWRLHLAHRRPGVLVRRHRVPAGQSVLHRVRVGVPERRLAEAGARLFMPGEPAVRVRDDDVLVGILLRGSPSRHRAPRWRRARGHVHVRGGAGVVRFNTDVRVHRRGAVAARLVRRGRDVHGGRIGQRHGRLRGRMSARQARAPRSAGLGASADAERVEERLAARAREREHVAMIAPVWHEDGLAR